MSWERNTPMESKAPHLMRFSTTRLFRSAYCIRWQKSANPAKGPFASRSFTTAWLKPWPTPLIAARPKRMLPSTTVKVSPDWFTSGGSSWMPHSRHSAMYSAILSLESSTEVSRAAMYSRV